MNKVIVAGSIIMDMAVQVERHPAVGETIIGNNLKYGPGGKGANQAVSASRLGAEVTMIGMVGDDPNGNEILNFLQDNNITCEIEYDRTTSTGVAFIVVDKNTGNNNIVVVLGANESLEERHVENIVYRKNDVLVSQFEIPLKVVKRFFHKGRYANGINILNPAPAQEIPQDILDLIDILIVNETELEIVSGFHINKNTTNKLGAIEYAVNLLNYKGIVIVTMGEDGAYGFMDKKWSIYRTMVKVPSVKVNAIDTTGAGDCFVGAIAAKSAEKKINDITDLREAIEFANLAASISVTRLGSAPSLPCLEEVNDNLLHM